MSSYPYKMLIYMKKGRYTEIFIEMLQNNILLRQKVNSCRGF
jgi:hypothetical protein